MDAINRFVAENAYKPVAGSDYYLMKATRSCRQIYYRISFDTTRELGGESELVEIVGLDIDRTNKEGATHILVRKWDKEFRVMYQAEKITFSLGGPGVPKVSSKELASQVNWQADGDPDESP